MSKNGGLCLDFPFLQQKETLSFHVLKTIDNNETFVFNATLDLTSTFMRSNNKFKSNGRNKDYVLF